MLVKGHRTATAAIRNDVLLLVSAVFYLSVPVLAKPKRSGHGLIPCQRVFVIGDQAYSVLWSDKNLFKETCMAPVANPSKATAVLVLEPVPGVTPGYSAAPREDAGSYWVDCRSSGGAESASVTCDDSEGREETTTCYEDRWGGVDCQSYNGNLFIDLGAAIKNLLLRSAAYAYLYDSKTHKLLWKYEGSWPWDAELAYAGSCEGKAKFGFGPVVARWQCDKRKLPVNLVPRAGGN